MKSLNNLYFIFTLLILSACCDDDDSQGMIAYSQSQPSYFSRADLNDLFNECKCDSLRLYDAEILASKRRTLMAVGVENGRDKPFPNYNMFVEISNGQVKRELIDHNEAKVNFEKISIGERFAVTFSKNEIEKLFSSNRADGVLFFPFVNLKGHQSLFSRGALFDNGQITYLPEVIINENPCPINCGAHPAAHYLAPMKW